MNKNITITFPDGTQKEFESGVTGEDIAGSIGTGLLKAALAINVNSNLQDLYLPINEDAEIAIITSKDEDGLEIIRHDAAHILAQAVKELFPKAQITIGPVIENGFYYDIAYEEHFTLEDLEKIEARMKEIVKRDDNVRREVWDRDEAIKFFKSIDENYKAEIISAIPQGEQISLYRQGDFIDLCRGPHAPSTGKIKAFKLMKLAGAYWRGDSNNEMLQRIYGTAWANKDDLNSYLTMLEEAEKRDHRKLGRELDLFHIQEEAVGQVFWHPKGWSIFLTLEQYIRKKLLKYNYQEVKTPILVDKILWEKSGHWDKFRENMFMSESEDKHLAIKPMNCPCHVQIFNKSLHSYRDLPLRMSEFGSCHRNEPSGALHGLMRVRGFTQDDAHIFCTEDQITSETVSFCNLLLEVYKDFGFSDVMVKFSDRPEKRAGSDEIWDRAEKSLKDAVGEAGLEYTLNPGEGAFYGPKLEFVLTDAIGRHWQCGTLQVDFVLPERLDANYITPEGNKSRPVMLHRALLGSLERFMGILIEEFSGRFPLWLAPTQMAVMAITSDINDYAHEIYSELKENNIRVIIDDRNEKINYKIREHSMQKIPLLIIVGKNEKANNTVTIRRFGSEEQIKIAKNNIINHFINELKTP